jgi:DNA-binding response OmpR family regulator
VTRVIVVEDEDLVRRAISSALRDEGFAVSQAADAYACRAALQQQGAEAVVLDLGLPGVSGLDLARELRSLSDIALIVVSRRSEPEARIEALDLGADDFLVKPVHTGELAARLRSVLRRRSVAHGRRIRLGRWSVDLDARDARAGEASAGLTRGEFEILARLIEARGKIVSRDELLRAISRNPAESDVRSVDALVSRLRRKLGDGPEGPTLIVTAPGFGYRLAAGLEPAL